MRQTLFHIPHELFGLPLFGFGLALAVWAIVLAVVLWKSWRGRMSADLLGFGLVMAVVGAVIVVVMPNLEARDFEGSPIGLPIRGYGVFLMFAVLSGVVLAAYRSQRAGMHPDTIYSLAFWMFAAGIIGARLFFVIEYWEEFQADSVGGTLVAVLKFTEGGLVVYGSLIGALLAFAAFCWKHKLPPLALGDVIAPSLALGLAIGRIGCLMNGCCFGGVCIEGPSIQFPKGSQPYVRHAQSGELLGLKLAPLEKGATQQKVLSVQPLSEAARIGVKAEQMVQVRSPRKAWKEALAQPKAEIPVVALYASSGLSMKWGLEELPEWSLPVHPTQLYSAGNATLLLLLVLAYHPLRRRDGETLALLLSLYPITRYLLEMIRTDEPGQFGTALTISQWVSIAMLVFAAGLWTKLLTTPKDSFVDLRGAGIKPSS